MGNSPHEGISVFEKEELGAQIGRLELLEY